MINANELRIGNWVTDQFYDSFKTMIQVDSQNDKGINLIIEDDGRYPEIASRWIEPEYKYEQLFGIPLTPEILDKCGFEYDLITFNKGECPILLAPKLVNCYTVYINRLFYGEMVTINHLHQLQNLYHVLMGEELEINL